MTPLLRAAQVAELLNVSEWFVLEHARRGDIPHRKIGGRIRFTPEDVAAYIDRAARAQQQPEKPSMGSPGDLGQ